MSDASGGSMLRRLLTGQNVKKDEIKEANVDFKILVLTPKLTETNESHKTEEDHFKHENIDISYKFVSNTDIDLDCLDIEVFKKNPQNILNCADDEHIELINHTNETLQSEKCTTTFGSKPAVHERKKSLECNICNANFTNSANLKRHVSSVHEGIKSFQCNTCRKSFTSKHSLCSHITAVHEGKKPFKCDICDYSCSQRADLNKHVASVHEGKKAFKCGICDYSCSQKVYLKRHVASVHKYADIDYLDFEPASKKTAEDILNCADDEHIKLINHTEETFESEKCTVTFSSKSAVHERKKSDTDVDLDCLDIEPILKENPKDTPNCLEEELIESIHHAKEKSPTTFASKSGIHERKKPFKCDNCDKSFRQKAHLQRHVASVHEGIKSFQCNDCAKYFTTKRSMCDHIATVHELKKPFHCDICNRCFTSKAYIAKHIANVHEGTNLTLDSYSRKEDRSKS